MVGEGETVGEAGLEVVVEVVAKDGENETNFMQFTCTIHFSALWMLTHVKNNSPTHCGHVILLIPLKQ